jgi:hypothetical protein
MVVVWFMLFKTRYFKSFYVRGVCGKSENEVVMLLDGYEVS